MTNTKTEEVIAQAISDLDDIETAIEEMGVDVPYDTDTKEYGNIIRDMVQSKTAEAYDEGYAKGVEESRGVTTGVTDFSYYNYNNQHNQIISQLRYADTSSGTTFLRFCCGSTKLKEIPAIDTGKCTNMSYFCYQCYSLKTVSQFNTDSVTILDNAFNMCYGITEIKLTSTAKATTLVNAFKQCNALQSVSPLDLTACTTATDCFYECRTMEEITLYNTNKVNSFFRMFSGCLKLKTVGTLDFTSATSVKSTFDYCKQLMNLSVVENSISITGMSLTASTLLSKNSIISVINGLSPNATSNSITLSQTAVNSAFETSTGAADGSTSDEWLALRATKSNWTISLS